MIKIMVACDLGHAAHLTRIMIEGGKASNLCRVVQSLIAVVSVAATACIDAISLDKGIRIPFGR